MLSDASLDGGQVVDGPVQLFTKATRHIWPSQPSVSAC